MTDTKLREARIAEAIRLQRERSPSMDPLRARTAGMEYLIDLIETNWRPEPVADPVTLAFKAWVTEKWGDPNAAHENSVAGNAFRAGHAHALANCADVRRMDWLEEQSGEITLATPGLMPASDPDEDAGAPLRTKIDRAMEGERVDDFRRNVT